MKTDVEQARAVAEKASLEYAQAAAEGYKAEQALYKTPAYLHLTQCNRIREQKLEATCKANKILATLEHRCFYCGGVCSPELAEHQRSIALQRATV
jgi:hypothetical protein